MRDGYLTANQGVFRCPSDKRGPHWQNPLGWAYNSDNYPWSCQSYEMNGHFMCYDTGYTGMRPSLSFLQGIGPMGEVPMLQEYRNCGGWIFGFCHGSLFAQEAHPTEGAAATDDPKRGSNYMFMDGHGAFEKDKDKYVMKKVSNYVLRGTNLVTRAWPYTDRTGTTYSLNSAYGYLGIQGY
jgi:hypothetical protein